MKLVFVSSALLASATALPALVKRSDGGAEFSEQVITFEDGQKFWWMCGVGYCFPMIYEEEKEVLTHVIV